MAALCQQVAFTQAKPNVFAARKVRAGRGKHRRAAPRRGPQSDRH